MITKTEFGKMPTGELIYEYRFSNSNGAVLKAINYGGIITELHIPDARGNNADVVLGFHNLEDYVSNHHFFGALIGRVAGRLTAGKFSLDGKNYNVAINDPPGHLHGGIIGFDKRVWDAQILDDKSGTSSLQLTYCSPNGEEGYPGDVKATVTYTLTDTNEVVIEYQATTNQATPLSLTSHSYFNLQGEGSGTINDHILQIFADEYVPTDEQMTLQDRRESVVGKANDFTKSKRMGDAIPNLLKNHGDNYLIPRRTASELKPVAKVTDPKSGRVMETFSTERCLQFYTGVALDGTLIGKSDKPYPSHAGFCLECHGYPNGFHTPEIGNIILQPGETYRQITVYKFSTTEMNKS